MQEVGLADSVVDAQGYQQERIGKQSSTTLTEIVLLSQPPSHQSPMSPDRIGRTARLGRDAHWPICQCIALVESPRISTTMVQESACLLQGEISASRQLGQSSIAFCPQNPDIAMR